MKKQFILTYAVIRILGVCIGILFPLYSYSQNYFMPGIEWNIEIHRNGAPFLYETQFIKELSDDVDNVYGLFSYTTGTDLENLQCEAEIKTDGEKVYFKDPSDDNDTWYLMYDFGLQEGESVEIFTPTFLSNHRIPDAITLTCKEIVENNPDFDGWTTMTMVEEEVFEGESHEREISWIKGLGDFRGPLANYSVFLTGGGSLLLSASYDNSVVYTSPYNGINYTDAVSPINLKIIDNILDIHTDNAAMPVWVYSINGNLIGVKEPTNISDTILLPAKGVYIVKSGDKSFKVIY